MKKQLFRVRASKYVKGKTFDIIRPASLHNPKDNAVMFISPEYLGLVDSFRKCNNCLVFWPEGEPVPDDLINRHAICVVPNARIGYCGFFRENNIVYYPSVDDFEIENGAFVARTAKIGIDCSIMPGAYIGGDVEIGDNCYIGAGAKLVGTIHIGNNVIIRENTVVGADGLSTDRDKDGKALTMPQFGGVIIEDDVQIGALTVVARGAIDNTIIKRGSKIDNCTFISHNVQLGEDTFVVGETIMFGSSSTGKQVYISGNSTIKNGQHVGDHAIIGMGSVVLNSVEKGAIVKGNPAK